MIRPPLVRLPSGAAGEFQTQAIIVLPPRAVTNPGAGLQSSGYQHDELVPVERGFKSDGGALGAQVLQQAGGSLAAVPDLDDVRTEIPRAFSAFDQSAGHKIR